MTAAVIFDLDGVLVDSESAWDQARRGVVVASGSVGDRGRRDLVAGVGGRGKREGPRAMLGMGSPEWSRYGRDELGVRMRPEDINAAVVENIDRRYRAALPLIPDA